MARKKLPKLLNGKTKTLKVKKDYFDESLNLHCY